MGPNPAMQSARCPVACILPGRWLQDIAAPAPGITLGCVGASVLQRALSIVLSWLKLQWCWGYIRLRSLLPPARAQSPQVPASACRSHAVSYQWVLSRYCFRDFLASMIKLQGFKNTFICSSSSPSILQKQYYTFESHCPANLLPKGCLVSSKTISSA